MAIATALEHYMLKLVNDARALLGLDPLQMEQHLNDSADAHSDWMLETNTFSHTGIGGSTPHERIVDHEFQLGGSWSTGENIALGTINGADSYYDEVEWLFDGLMNSPGHYANMMSDTFTYMGVGISFGDFAFDAGTYASIAITQNFGATTGAVNLDIRAESSDGIIRGSKNADQMFGSDGADVMKGMGGNDVIYGGDGNDSLAGGRGEDILYGGAGANKLFGQKNADTLYGGDENDVLNGGGGGDLLYGYGGDDYLKGGTRSDILHGGDGDDILLGNKHDDFLYGGGGDDRLNGGGYNDLLQGGSGDDVIHGGSGADVFVFVENADEDRIDDFEVGIDALLLDASYWAGFETAEDLVAEMASVTVEGVVFDFGEDTLVLEGLTSTDGLASSMDMI